MSTPVEIAQANGIVIPQTAWDESQAAGVPYEVTLAMLDQESGGGSNVYGHDGGAGYWFSGAGTVTQANYAVYKAGRAAHGAQGVGPMQLTSPGYQDAADSLGGCWVPRHNVTEGLRIIAGYYKATGSWHESARRYNAGGASHPPAGSAYADQVTARITRWQALLAGATPPGGPPMLPQYQRLTWRGHQFDKMTVAAIMAAEAKGGLQGVITQGSYTTAVGASGGTHAGGGALDLHYDPATAAKLVLAFRQVGFAAWRRYYIPGLWPDHIHCELLGNTMASSEAKAQWADYRNRRDGLASNGPDNGPRLDPIPLFHYQTAPVWPRLHTTTTVMVPIQAKLAFAGYYQGGDAPGYYGTHTRAAIRVLQLAHHWANPDGLFGPVTWATVQALPGPPAWITQITGIRQGIHAMQVRAARFAATFKDVPPAAAAIAPAEGHLADAFHDLYRATQK